MSASIALNFLSVTNSLQPAKELLAAILKVKGERTDLTPSNPNSKENQETGISEALQTVYSLSGSQPPNNELPSNDVQTKLSDKASLKLQILSTILNTTQCGFVVLNKNRHIIYSNNAAPIRINSAGDKEISVVFNGKDDISTWIDECDNNAINAEKTWARVPDRLPNNAGRRIFDIVAFYQKDSKTETIITFIDRTEVYNKDEEDLDFIAFAAHELRGPITVIRGYSDILQDELKDKLEGDQAELFHRLAVSSSRLSNYIDNILNTSRYDRRHLKVNLLEDSVKNVYDTIADDMEMRANAQNRLLSVSIPDNLPTVAVDKASMSEVFSNLIDNAIKYSNEGGVINVSAKTEGDFVAVSVQDNGIGMPESVVENLFQKFYRSHRSRETVAGTGIGLYVSKAIVESHGGTISVSSRDGYGSTFTVLIPIYATVANKLLADNNSNEAIMNEGKGWINNHNMFRG